MWSWMKSSNWWQELYRMTDVTVWKKEGYIGMASQWALDSLSPTQSVCVCVFVCVCRGGGTIHVYFQKITKLYYKKSKQYR